MKTVRVKASTAVPASISAMLQVAASAAEHVQAAAPHSGHATPSDVAAAVAAHESALAPHTKAQVGLGLVDNTADASKPVSGPQAAAIATAKAEAIAACPPETAATIGAITSGATAKAAPVDADSVGLSDSAADGLLKKLTWANLKSSIATYLDGFYARLAGAPGGQTLNGGTGAGDSLTLNSTTNATNGVVNIAGGLGYFSQALQRLGIGVSSPTARVHIQSGTAAAGTAPLKVDAGVLTTVPEAGAVERTADHFYFTPSTLVGRRRIATEIETFGGVAGYPNGGGDLRSAAGFSSLSLDQVYTDDAVGSFVSPLAANTTYLGDIFPINPKLYYRVACSIGAGDADGSSYSASNRQYLGLVFLDRRQQQIFRYQTVAVPGTLTTLVVPLNAGDLTMTLASAANWSTAANLRHFCWPYTDPEGCVYPAGGYAGPNSSKLMAGFGTEAWGASGINYGSGVVTLSQPWTGPSLPAGTAVWNAADNGGTYWYALMANQQAPLGWTPLEAIIGPYTYGQLLPNNTIPAGTAFARLVLRANYHGVPDTKVRLKGLSITPVAPGNFPAAIGVGSAYRSKHTSELPANGLAVEGRLGIGTPSPAAALHIIATAALLRMGYDTSNYCTVDVSSGGVATLTTVGTAPAFAIAGDVRLDKTITPGGTTGAQTINKQMGSVNVAAGQSSVVVTNNRVTTSSVIVATVATADATLKSVVAVAASGSFTLTGNAAASAETRVNFVVLN